MINHAWREFACNNGGPGSSYLDACHCGANTADADDAQAAAEGIRALLKGERDSFSLEYPCHSPEAERSFLMHAAPIKHPSGGVVISHIDVSAWKQRQESG